MFKYLLAFLLFFTASTANAGDVMADRTPANPGSAFTITLCSAETDTGICEIDAEDAYALFNGYYAFQLISRSSTASAYSCSARTSDDTPANDSTGSDDMSVTLTETVDSMWWDGPLMYMWFNCTTITGGNVTIKALVYTK